MSKGKSNVLRAQRLGELCGTPGEPQDRLAAGSMPDLNILPGHASAQAGADGFHCCFLSCKTGCISLHRILFGSAIANLVFSEYTIEKSAPEALNCLCNAIHFCDVNA